MASSSIDTFLNFEGRVYLVSGKYRHDAIIVVPDTVVYKLYINRKKLNEDSDYTIEFDNIEFRVESSYLKPRIEPVQSKVEISPKVEFRVKYGSVYADVKYKEDGVDRIQTGAFVFPLRSLLVRYGYYKR